MSGFRLLDVDMASISPLITEIIAGGGSAELTVSGNSMRPLFEHRVSRVRLSAADRFRLGDVVLYRRDSGAYVLHRIVQQKDCLYTMRGDNQYVPEPGVRCDQILAVMTAFSRDGVRWHDCRSFAYVLYRVIWVRSCFLRRKFRVFLRRIFSLLRRIKQR